MGRWAFQSVDLTGSYLFGLIRKRSQAFTLSSEYLEIRVKRMYKRSIELVYLRQGRGKLVIKGNREVREKDPRLPS